MRLIILLIILSLPLFSFGQYEKYLQESPEPSSESQWGGAFSVVESGSGLGVFYAKPLKNFYHIGVAFDAFMLRDSKQFEYYSYAYQTYLTGNKQNNVYVFDLLFTIKKRLLAHAIDDQFRPFIALNIGPVFGMNFPEATNEAKVENEFEWAANVALAAGADVALDGNYMLGLRLQYRFMKFTDILGERQNHSMFDVRLEFGKLF
ncbi:MAG: hypothetical protein P8Y99_05505 [Calditrichaceae bacterium]|jgi:hypothetical protein